jgi:predicted RNase H-like HicB family nuclease
MKDIELTSVVYKEGKYFVSQCLDVDVSSFGKTKKEALKHLGEALSLYYEDRPKAKASVHRAEIETVAFAHA